MNLVHMCSCLLNEGCFKVCSLLVRDPLVERSLHLLHRVLLIVQHDLVLLVLEQHSLILVSHLAQVIHSKHGKPGPRAPSEILIPEIPFGRFPRPAAPDSPRSGKGTKDQSEVHRPRELSRPEVEALSTSDPTTNGMARECDAAAEAPASARLGYANETAAENNPAVPKLSAGLHVPCSCAARRCQWHKHTTATTEGTHVRRYGVVRLA